VQLVDAADLRGFRRLRQRIGHRPGQRGALRHRVVVVGRCRCRGIGVDRRARREPDLYCVLRRIDGPGFGACRNGELLRQRRDLGRDLRQVGAA